MNATIDTTLGSAPSRSRPGRARIWLALYLLLGLGSAPAQNVEQRLKAMEQRHAQEMKALRDDYEARISRLEGRVGGLQSELDDANAEDRDAELEQSINALARTQDERRGIGSRGQTTIFDNVFNPAISVVGDFVFAATDKTGSFADQNRFILRSVEVGFVGRVDPLMSYSVFIHFDEEEVELEEAFGLVDDWLPDTLELKFGRYNIDFGKLSPVHDHDLPFVDKPQVLQEYLGGSLRGTGLELHHWFGIGDTHLIRWSAGVVNRLDGDAHAVFGPAAGEGHGHGEEEAEAFGERDVDNFAFTARVTALFELCPSATLQVGASLAWAPEDRQFFEMEPAMPGGDEILFGKNLDRLLVGGDVTFVWSDPAAGRELRIGGEVLFSDQETYEEEDDLVLHADSLGFYAFAEWLFDPRWSVGASGGWFEHAEDDDLDSWDVGLFVTFRVDEFNRLRLEGRYFDDPEEEYWGIMLQWTVILGSHGHGIDW